jgi:hypothetical protein
MNTHAWRQHIAATDLPTVAQATIITRTISDTGLSGTFAYDDSVTVAGAGAYSGWTFAALTSFAADYGPTHTTSWDLGDYVQPTGYDLYFADDGAG